MLYAFAFILDPRAKLRGFSNILRLLSGLSGTDYSLYYTCVKSELSTMFNKYDLKFGAVRQQVPPPPSVTGKRKQNWGLIYGFDCTSEFPYSGSITPNLGSGTSASALLQQAHSSAGLSSLDTKLTSYLESDTLQKFDEDFNILNWWHEHKLSYHVLFVLSADVISVPVSTISLESAFSLCGRIIEERRRRLALEMVEMLLCMKDWELSEARGQHCTQDQELEDAFEGLYIDDP
jgi:hypothetical protein